MGRKTSSTDSFGNTTFYEHDAFGRLMKVSYPEMVNEEGKVTQPTFTYTYDIFGNALTITDPKGFVTRKRYNLYGNPTSILHPDGSSELFKYDTEGSLHRSLSRDRIIAVYEYDYLGRLIHEESSAAGERGTSTFLVSRSQMYNAFRCISERHDNRAIDYQHDPAGRLISVTTYDTKWKDEEENPKARTTEFAYDSMGRVSRKKVWFDGGPEDYSVECFEYDLLGNVTEKRVEDVQGNILLRKAFDYDSNGRCIAEYAFDHGQKVAISQTSHDARGEPIRYCDALGNETHVQVDEGYHNALGQTVVKKTVTSPLGIQTEMEFDALGHIVAIAKKDLQGVLLSSQKMAYDPLGNKAAEVHEKICDGHPLGKQELRWVYGPMGRLEEEIQGYGTAEEKRTKYAYNTLGQVTEKNLHHASSLTYSYNNHGRLYKIEAREDKKDRISNRYSYDRKGNIISAAALYGKSAERYFNAFDEVEKETIEDEVGKYTLSYAYDRKGRLTSVTLPDLSKIVYRYDALFCREVQRLSPEGEILYAHTYDAYNESGKLLNETLIGDTGKKKHVYGISGQEVLCQTDYLQQEYDYDPIGRLLEVKTTEAKFPAPSAQFAYNSLSQLVSNCINL